MSTSADCLWVAYLCRLLVFCAYICPFRQMWFVAFFFCSTLYRISGNTDCEYVHVQNVQFIRKHCYDNFDNVIANESISSKQADWFQLLFMCGYSTSNKLRRISFQAFKVCICDDINNKTTISNDRCNNKTDYPSICRVFIYSFIRDFNDTNTQIFIC